ncbi:conserved hypothetical protein [Paraburkholderia ribeironis]|uniref:Uncharacterized protein n=1 Tax=Paraburkholderia ribeironis TaxID=1247936 RepID=A0A1N7RSX3_9BURK|nr:hypothetical protein [Paraburkholderia ribeironis]SIT38198.1 conserved hypothetical protein [Paraburkholderia ribeironis]
MRQASNIYAPLEACAADFADLQNTLADPAAGPRLAAMLEALEATVKNVSEAHGATELDRNDLAKLYRGHRARHRSRRRTGGSRLFGGWPSHRAAFLARERGGIMLVQQFGAITGMADDRFDCAASPYRCPQDTCDTTSMLNAEGHIVSYWHRQENCNSELLPHLLQRLSALLWTLIKNHNAEK